MADVEKVLKGLEICKQDGKLCFSETECPFEREFPRCCQVLLGESYELIKVQNDIITELLKVGYPHNFQHEKPHIVDYMRQITEVVRKAVHLRNESMQKKTDAVRIEQNLYQIKEVCGNVKMSKEDLKGSVYCIPDCTTLAVKCVICGKPINLGENERHIPVKVCKECQAAVAFVKNMMKNIE